MSTKLETLPENSKKVPSAVDLAQELINSRPDLFKDDRETQVALAGAMINFFKECDAYLNPPIDLFEEIGNVVKMDAKLRYGINL